ncbi:MAG: hypothetical protein CL565_01120 [Alphaproteobacteria bacterium]|nr:hypothetical protein [Alphaproteobacteria bacterium]
MGTSDSIKDTAYLEEIDKIARTIQSTTLGKPSIEIGVMEDVNISFENHMATPAAFCNSLLAGKEISLNAECDFHTLVIAMAHELRHVEQYFFLGYKRNNFSLEDALKLERLLEADASAFASGLAWELYNKTGEEEYLLAMEKMGDGDIQQAFNNAAHSSSDKNFDAPTPFRAAFNAWFQNPIRRKSYDDFCTKSYFDIENSALSTFFFKNPSGLTLGLLKDIGSLSKGNNYLNDNDFLTNIFHDQFFFPNRIYEDGLGLQSSGSGIPTP